MTAPFEVPGNDHVPAHAYLTQFQLERLRVLLAEQLIEQDDALEEHDEALTDATEDVVDAAVTSGRELAEAYVLFARAAAADLQEALDRMAAGSYGYCESCHAPISYERLEAIPETKFCVLCPRIRGLFS
jgi:DnaK suppressor protein